MSNAKNSETVLTDDQIHNLWIMRKDLHGGDLMAQLEDFARAVLEAAQPATAVREPLTDEQVSYLEQQAFASTNHTIERPIYQHWFRKGVRAGYGITGDSNG